MYKLFTNIGTGICFLVLAAVFVPSYCLAGTDSGFFIQDGLLEGVNIEAAKLGDTMPIAEFRQKTKDYSCSVIVGKSNEPHIAALLKKQKVTVDNDWLGEQGYQVVVSERTGGRDIVVTAATETGVLYGLIGLRLRAEKANLDNITQWETSYRDRPVFRYRNGQGSLRGNMNWSQVTRESNTGIRDGTPERNIFRYEQYPEVFVDEQFKKDYLELVEENEGDLRKRLADAKKYGEKIYYFTYQPTLAAWAREGFFSAHPEAKPVDTTPVKKWLCPSADISKKLTYDKWHSLFKRFPDSGGVILTISAGDSGGLHCDCEKCSKYPMHQRVVDYIKIIRSAIQSVNPKAVVMVRAWRLPTDVFELAEELPDDIIYRSKLTCPPGNDYLWTDNFCRYVNEGLPRFIASGVCTWTTDSPSDNIPFLCYTGPKQKERGVKLAEKGCEGAWTEPYEPYADYTDPEDILRQPSRAARIECGWDPYAFDPDEYLHSWAVKRFGAEVGIHVFNAFKETNLIADSFILEPNVTNTLHMYVYQGCSGAGYAGATNSPEDLLLATSKDIDRFRDKFEIPRSIEIAIQARDELLEAAKLAPDNTDIQIYLTMAKDTVHLTKMWQNYHLSLLYKCVEKNTQDHSQAQRYKALARSYAVMAYEQLPGYLEHYLKIYPHLVNGDQFLKHPGLYNAFITQQVNNAYHQAVLRPACEKSFPVIRSRVSSKQVSTDGSSYIVNLNEKDSFVPERLSREGLKHLTLNFKGDLSKGGMLHFIYSPYCKKEEFLSSPPNRYGGASAYLEFTLNGRKLTSTFDFRTRHSNYKLSRYIELPKTSGSSHSIEISLVNGHAAQFQRMYIYGPAGSEKITPTNEVVPFTEDFSKPVQWKLSADQGARCSAEYDADTQDMLINAYRQSAKGVVYMDLPDKYASDFTFECDLVFDQAKLYSMGHFKLFGGEEPEQWKLRPVYSSGHDKLYGPTREGHYGLSMVGHGETVNVTPFVMDSSRTLVPAQGYPNPHIELKVGERYRFKIDRYSETAHFVITDPSGTCVMDRPVELNSAEDFTIDKIGFQNHTSSKGKPPIVIHIDNINFE